MANNMKSTVKLTKEEEFLLQDLSRSVSTKSSALFYGNAFIVSVLPIWLFWRIHDMDIMSNAVPFIVGSIISSYLVAMAYKNTKFILKHKIAVKREDAINREMNKKFGDDKKLTRKEKDERILWKKNEVADFESTTFSILLNNALFILIILISSFVVLRNQALLLNYALSMGSAAALVALFSTGSVNKQ